MLIYQSAVWDTPVSYNGNIKIKSGRTLEIKSQVKMGDGKYIEVERGAKLIVNGGHLTNLCDDYWQGIYVHGNAGQEQPDPESTQPLALDDAGVVLIKNSSIIEYALVGVHTFGKSIAPAEQKKYYGGVIFVENSRFFNNLIGVKFEDYQFNNKSKFSSTIFEEDFDELDNQRKVGVSIQGCERIEFDHCSFNDLFAGFLGFNFGAWIIDGNTFTDNEYGIVRFSFGPIFNRLIIGDIIGLDEDNIFTNNSTAVFLFGDTGPAQVTINHNQFFCGRWGIDVYNGADCYINKNKFQNVPFSIKASNSGNVRARCNDISNEDFDNFSIGIDFLGNCQNSEFVGNTFKKIKVNVRISEDIGILGQVIPGQVNGLQGIPGNNRTADNLFSPNADARIAIIGNTTPFAYYVPNTVPPTSNFYPEVNPTAYTISPWSRERSICFDNFIADEPEEELENIRDLVIDAETNLLANPGSEYWRIQHLSLINSREVLKNDLIAKYLEERDFIAAENILIGENPEIEKRLLYGISLKKGDLEEAENRLEMIGTNNTENLFFTQTQEIYLETIESLEPFSLTDDQKNILENIISTQNASKGVAESLLMTYDTENYELPEIACSECKCSAELNEKEHSTEDKVVSAIKVYPNPATDLININTTEIERNVSVKVEIYDSRGALVMAKAYPENPSRLTINTNDFNAGLYFLQVYQEDKLIFTDKLILMK